MNTSIAVVIPFYKPDFFKKLLTALSCQSDTEFKVFVANDASDPIAEDICNEFSETLDITYHRFDERMGHVSLAGQWNRSVALISDFDWVWVVPDDDLPSPDCIAEFRDAAMKADDVGSNVIHIPSITIDEHDTASHSRSGLPFVMSSDEFYLSQLKGLTPGMSLANAVYRKKAFDSAGQFISFPRGWGSDHATTLAVAAGGPIVTLPHAWLGFRMSGLNISSQTDDVGQKLEARLGFATWLAEKAPKWYGPDMAQEMLRWFYLKGELYVIRIWPFSIAMALRLFDLADICGVRLSAGHKAGIILRGCHNVLKNKLRGAMGLKSR